MQDVEEHLNEEIKKFVNGSFDECIKISIEKEYLPDDCKIFQVLIWLSIVNAYEPLVKNLKDKRKINQWNNPNI